MCTQTFLTYKTDNNETCTSYILLGISIGAGISVAINLSCLVYVFCLQRRELRRTERLQGYDNDQENTSVSTVRRRKIR